MTLDELTPEKVRKVLRKHKIKQIQIAEFSKIDKQTISAWLTGRYTMSKATKVLFYLIVSFPEEFKKLIEK